VTEHDDIGAALRSTELSVRISAVERAATCGSEYVDAVVALLEAFPDDGYFVLERIGRFGEAALGPLSALYDRAETPQVKLLCALALAHFRRSVEGDRALLDAVRLRSEYEHLACRALGWLSSTAAVPMLVQTLEQTSPQEQDRIVSLVGVIRALGGEVSPSEQVRLRAGGHPEVLALLRAC
jgi:hypothetical protein